MCVYICIGLHSYSLLSLFAYYVWMVVCYIIKGVLYLYILI